MAVVTEINDKEWGEWVNSRPESVQKLCKQFPPNRIYLLKPSGHRVTLYSYNEDGTMTVNVTGEYNAVVFSRRVFGIKPEELEECDLPDKDEPCGEMLTNEDDINSFIEERRKEIEVES